MIECLSKHFEKIQVLNISHNRIGTKGAEKLAAAFKEMKALTTLDLSFDEIGDQGICYISEQLHS
jgi:Ran GTPase-activating protein (RanGAP) involved in mRNA processing and transport